MKLMPNECQPSMSAMGRKQTFVECQLWVESRHTIELHGPETRGTLMHQPCCATVTRPLPKEVLVVEDEPLIRMAAADALTDYGIMAWEAGDAEEALDALEKHPRIGVIFTDVNMPGEMNGLGLAHEVSVTHPDVKLIVTRERGQLRTKTCRIMARFCPSLTPRTNSSAS